MTTIGHLKPGVTTQAADRAKRPCFASQLEAEHPIPNFDRRLEVVPIWQVAVRRANLLAAGDRACSAAWAC